MILFCLTELFNESVNAFGMVESAGSRGLAVPFSAALMVNYRKFVVSFRLAFFFFFLFHYYRWLVVAQGLRGGGENEGRRSVSGLRLQDRQKVKVVWGHKEQLM